MLIDLADIRAQVTTLKAKIDRYAEYQQTLELPVSDTIEGIKSAIDNLARIETLWETVNKWQEIEELYNTTPFVTMKKEDIANDLESVWRKATDLVNWNPENLVAKSMLEKIEQYEKMLSHILSLANPAIHHRHWFKLFQAVGQHYDEDTIFTLSQMKLYGILSRKFFIYLLCIFIY